MKNNKTIKIVIIIVAVVIVSLLISPFLPETENINYSQDNQNTKSDKKSNYLTKIEWTNQGNDYSDETDEWLKVAVEVDNYDGDIIESGTYNVEQTDGKYTGKPQRIYNVYVSSLNTDNPEDIKNNEFPVTVGGANGKKQTITVEKGQYLYIQKISGGEIGHLLISK